MSIIVPGPSGNGNGKAEQTEQEKRDAQLIEVVASKYPQFFGKLGALCVLLAGVPLEALKAANRRQFSTVVFTNPNATAQELATYKGNLDNDLKLLEAALALQKIAAQFGIV